MSFLPAGWPRCGSPINQRQALACAPVFFSQAQTQVCCTSSEASFTAGFILLRRVSRSLFFRKWYYKSYKSYQLFYSFAYEQKANILAVMLLVQIKQLLKRQNF